MANTTVAETPEDDFAGLRKRAAEGDTKSVAFLAEIEETEAKKNALRVEELAKESAAASLQRAKDKAFKSRKVKTGITLITGGQSHVFEDCLAAAINFIQEHGGDVMDISFGLKNSTHTALVQYTVDIEIADVTMERLRAVQAHVKSKA